jgi:NitT/TauT family transport system ATP-binding protein
MTSLLQANSIAKQFRQSDGQVLQIIGKIDLALQPGEIVCLLGASGSGKTTLLRILSGFDAPDQGTIQSDIKRPSPQFGYLSQNDHLLPWRTVVGNVMLGLELIGQSKEIAKLAALAALQLVGMGKFAVNYPIQLSGGMQQRVLLARTLALQPKLLLMDEPMSSLDVLARRELATLIKEYTRSHQSATLVVTHSVEEACFLADRILLVTRSPAKLHKEIHISDNKDQGLFRSEAMDTVMRELWSALGAAT